MWRKITSSLAIVFLLLISSGQTIHAQESTPEPPVEHPGRPIGDIIRSLLGFSSLFANGSNYQAGQSSSQDPAIAYYAAIPHSRTADGAFVLGDPNAAVTIIVFEDFTCPPCQRYKTVADSFIQTYVVTGQARFEFRAFPVHDPTYMVLLPQLAECADNQQPGMFWPAYDVIFQMELAGQVGPSITQDLANRLGLDGTTLENCAPSAQQVYTDFALARQLGIQSTPSVMVRYGDGEPQFITVNGQTYTNGGVPLEVLGYAVQNINNVPIGRPA